MIYLRPILKADFTMALYYTNRLQLIIIQPALLYIIIVP